MNFKLQLLLAVVVVVTLASYVDAQKRRSGGRGRLGKSGRKGPPRGRARGRLEERLEEEGDRFEWTREVASPAATLDEGAFVPTNSNVVVVKSSDPERNFSRALSIYDFSTDPAVVAVRLRPGVCFVFNVSLDYQGTVDALTARNATTVSAAVDETMDGTGEALSEEDKADLLDSNPGLRRACGFGRIVNLDIPSAATIDPATTKEIEFFTFDSKITLTVPQRQGPRGGSFRPGGRRPGGRRPGGRRPNRGFGDKPKA